MKLTFYWKWTRIGILTGWYFHQLKANNQCRFWLAWLSWGVFGISKAKILPQSIYFKETKSASYIINLTLTVKEIKAEHTKISVLEPLTPWDGSFSRWDLVNVKGLPAGVRMPWVKKRKEKRKHHIFIDLLTQSYCVNISILYMIAKSKNKMFQIPDNCKVYILPHWKRLLWWFLYMLSKWNPRFTKDDLNVENCTSGHMWNSIAPIL